MPELNFPNEREYFQELAYLQAKRDIEQEQEWLESQQKEAKILVKGEEISEKSKIIANFVEFKQYEI